MAATSVNTAAQIQSSLPAGAAAPAGQGGGAVGGAAFLAILDQMLGLAAAGGEARATGLGEAGPGGAAKRADAAGGLPPWLLASTEADARNPGDAPAADGRPAGTPAAADGRMPGDGDEADANALLAGTVDPSLAALSPPPDSDDGTVDTPTTQRGQALAAAIGDTKSQLAESGDAKNKGATGEAVSDVAGRRSADAKSEPAPTAGPAAESALRSVTDAAGDPDLDTVLAALGRRPAEPAPAATAERSQAAATGTEQAARSADPAVQTADPRTRERDVAKAKPAAAAEKPKEASGSDRSAGDALTRLLAAGQAAAKGPLANATATPGDAAGTDGQASKPALVSSALLTINEVGGATPGQTAPATHSLTATGTPQIGDTARPNVEAMAVRIAHEARDGSQRFEIALDPPELGRVDVRLEFSRDGRMTTHLLVDRNDTLDALMRDGRGLERALQAHGLKLDDGGVQYHLRDQSAFAQHQQQQQHNDASDRQNGGAGDTTSPTSAAETGEPGNRRQLTLGGLDVTI